MDCRINIWIYFSIILYFALYTEGSSLTPTPTATIEDSCTSLNITGCCANATCFTGTCYCDQHCYQYNDCCPDIASIGCLPNSTVTPTSLCASLNITGCCNQSCFTGTCYCDKICYQFHDCCPDIASIGCLPNSISSLFATNNILTASPTPTITSTVIITPTGSCASLNITGCCANGTCYTGTGCYCDQLCYQYNDCCHDIVSIGCLPTASPAPSVTSTGSCASLNITGCCNQSCFTGTCYCDQTCYQFNDCCPDIASIRCLPNSISSSFSTSSILTASPTSIVTLTVTSTVTPTGSCASLNITGCCANGTCFTGTCYCDQICYQFNDCCPDIASIGCLPNSISSSFAMSSILTASPTPTITQTVTPTGFCSSLNITGCCNQSCFTGTCHCDQICYQFNDCCPDIASIGCLPNSISSSNSILTASPTPTVIQTGSCASLNITGCCANGTCFTGSCYCDQICYQLNDCCPDIASIGCLPNSISSSFAASSILTASPTPTVTSTVTPTGSCASLNITGCCANGTCYTGTGCYCDQLCYQYNDCCPDIASIGCLPNSISSSFSTSSILTASLTPTPLNFVCSSGIIRLVNGSTYFVNGSNIYEGRVELCLNNQWGTVIVCDDSLDSYDAQVACRQLGYSANGAVAFTYPYSGNGFWFEEVNCSGSEPSVLFCSANSIDGIGQCFHPKAAGVHCINITSVTPSLTAPPFSSATLSPSPTLLSTPSPTVSPLAYVTLNETISSVKCLENTQYSTAHVNAETRIPVEGAEFSSVFVGYNGVFSLFNRFLFWQPTLFPSSNINIKNSIAFAPFWNNIDIRREGKVCYQSFDVNNPLTEHVFNQIHNFIQANQNVSFVGTWMLVMEWKDVHPNPHSILEQYDISSQKILNQTNRFQANLITNGIETYIIYTYKCGDLNWDHFEYPTTIGYNVAGHSFVNYPLSGTQGAIAGILDCTNKNQGSDYYNVVYSFVNNNTEGTICRTMYFADLSLTKLSSLVAPSCPCTEFQAWFDQSFTFFGFQYTESFDIHYCYVNTFPIIFTGNSICCYSVYSGALITYGPSSSFIARYHPIFNASFYNEYDRDFQQACCVDSLLCNLFHYRRPVQTCINYVPPTLSWFWGDPHMRTLDGQTYTFNGIGEYIMLRSMSGELEVQARTVLATPNTTATVFSAIAATGDINKNESIQVNNNNNSFLVLYNGSDITSNITHNNNQLNYNTVQLTRVSNDTITISFLNGASLNITIQSGVLSFVILLPQKFRNKTTGLLGNFDGDKTNDYIYRNGTMLSINTTDRILHTFGQSWQVTEEESLFTYPLGQNMANFSDPNHIPHFLDEIDNTTREQAKTVCGTNIQCIFDFVQTGNEELAKSTQEIEEQNEKNEQISSNFPPIIEGLSIYVVNINQPSVYTLNITDPGDTFTVSINGQLPPGYTLVQSQSIWTLTIALTAITEFNFTVVATDSFNATSLIIPQVQICGCQNGGNCTVTGVQNPSSNPLILLCDCSEAYDGPFCENDADGCTEISCFNDASCIDLIAPLVGGKCPPCPLGYEGDGQSCRDMDECTNVTINGCSDLCVNTIGSFVCTCPLGYELNSDERTCIDINECATLMDDCEQVCTNKKGSYSCSCNNGYILQSNNRSCIVNPNNECPESNECEQLCAIQLSNSSNNLLGVCSCNVGYILTANMLNCTDIDECQESNNPCTQKCVNNIGSFSCACENGFTLESDGFTCTDINECLVAALNGEMICNSPHICSNTIGGFNCICPVGTVLYEGKCIEPQSTTIGSTISTSSITVSSEPVFSESLSTASSESLSTASSEALYTVYSESLSTVSSETFSTDSTSLVSPTISSSPSAVALDNRVRVTIVETLQTFTPEKRERFMNITASTINNYCARNKCEDVSRRKRDAKDSLFKRQSLTIVQPSDIIIIKIEEAPNGLQITFYVQTQLGVVVSANTVQNAVTEGIKSSAYENAGFKVTDVQIFTTLSNSNASALVTGTVIGVIVSVVLVTLLCFIFIFAIYIVLYKKNKNTLSEARINAADDDIIIKNEYYIPPTSEEEEFEFNLP